jgi:hypothetical protein
MANESRLVCESVERRKLAGFYGEGGPQAIKVVLRCVRELTITTGCGMQKTMATVEDSGFDNVP